ncbi:hypothetical protein MXB_4845 [Myxobolus squamalis]|nr:hypothetical protein MXB_4845 [Myxobolus squamalis]
MMGSENSCWPLSRKLSNPVACSNSSACLYGNPDFSHSG